MQLRSNITNIIKKYKIFFVFLIMFTVMSFASDAFLTETNIINLIRQISINGIISVGMTFVLVAGGIDLSVGSVVALASIIGANFAHPDTYPLIVPILVALAIGASVGLVNGIIIAKGHVVPFIVTMGMMTICRGLTLIYHDGTAVLDFSDSFAVIGGGSLWGIPIPIIVFVVIVIVFAFTLDRTRFGRYVYAIGGNPVSARVSGINTDRFTIAVYVISGVLAATAGIVLTSRVMAATVIAGQGYELDAIAACVIGGTSLSGGIGKIGGTIAGAFIIGLLYNGLVLLNVSSYFQNLIMGMIIIGAVFFDQYTNSKKKS